MSSIFDIFSVSYESELSNANSENSNSKNSQISTSNSNSVIDAKDEINPMTQSTTESSSSSIWDMASSALATIQQSVSTFFCVVMSKF